MAGSVVVVLPVDRPVLRHAALRHPGHRHDRHQVTIERSTPCDDSLILAAARRSSSSRRPGVATAGSGGRGTALERYAADTWHSFERMVDPRTGLPSDNIDGRPAAAQPLRVHVADEHRHVPVGDDRRARPRPHRATVRRAGASTGRCDSVERLERHEPSGQFYNWYDPATLEKLTIWPENGRPGVPVPVERRQRLAGRRRC